MLLTSNYNIELTAAILRDKSETVREHYAHLLPKDVRQPNNALTSIVDVAELRAELSRWIEQVRLDGDGRVWVKWKPQRIFEMLNLEPTSEKGESGSPFAHFRSKLNDLQTFHPVALAGTTVPAISGFSGFSGCFGLSGFCGAAASAIPAPSGFSGFSGVSAVGAA